VEIRERLHVEGWGSWVSRKRGLSKLRLKKEKEAAVPLIGKWERCAKKRAVVPKHIYKCKQVEGGCRLSHGKAETGKGIG